MFVKFHEILGKFLLKTPVNTHSDKSFSNQFLFFLAMNDYQYLNKIFSDLGEVATENADYFYLRQNPNHNFYKQFQTILNALDPLQISLEVVTSCCARFDISPSCKGLFCTSFSFIFGL